ncbi:MAG: hypothetical protein ACYDHN_07120 [Solirubrobacteraceae bacterium]
MAIALFAVALAGCGSSSSTGNGVASKTPTQIVAAATAAATGAATVHVSGSIVDEGKPIALDMELEAKKGGKGTITLEGLSVRLVQINGTVYINGSDAFYRHVAGSAAAQLLHGKWLKAPSTDANFASLASLTDLGKLISSTLAAHGALSSAGTTTVDGQKAVGVSDKAKGGTLYVATTGAAYPLEILKTGGGGGKIVFDRWNKSVTLTAPTDAININQLQSGH